MSQFPKGTCSSLIIKEVIEEYITTKLKIKLSEFDIKDFERAELNKIIEKINETYSLRSDKPSNEIFWQDFYDWYRYYIM